MAKPNVPVITKEWFLERATENAPRLMLAADQMAVVRGMIAKADIVMGVVIRTGEMHLIKGAGHLQSVMQSTVGVFNAEAVPCNDLEQAEALRRVLGDGAEG